MAASERMTPTIYNKTLTDADTEYSQALSAGCRHFSFQARTAVAVRFAFVTGKVAASTAPFGTLKAGSAFSSPEKLDCPHAGLTVYLASSSAGTVVEIVEWS